MLCNGGPSPPPRQEQSDHSREKARLHVIGDHCRSGQYRGHFHGHHLACCRYRDAHAHRGGPLCVRRPSTSAGRTDRISQVSRHRENGREWFSNPMPTAQRIQASHRVADCKFQVPLGIQKSQNQDRQIWKILLAAKKSAACIVFIWAQRGAKSQCPSIGRLLAVHAERKRRHTKPADSVSQPESGPTDECERKSLKDIRKMGFNELPNKHSNVVVFRT